MKRLPVVGGIQTKEESATVLVSAFCPLSSQKNYMFRIIPFFLSISLLLCSLSCLILPKTNCLLLLLTSIAQHFNLPQRMKSERLFHTPTLITVPKDNSWVLLSWKSSSVTPLLARSFINGPNALPNQARRRLTGFCIEEDHLSGKMNKTHHFHKYEKAVDSHKLTPPFRQDEWQVFGSLNPNRHAATIILPDLVIMLS